MLQLQRQNDIMRLLEEHQEITVKELCSTLYSSPATIRRDLADLEKRGLLKRSFGGAVLTATYIDQLPLAIRSTKHIAEKKKICSKAVQEFVHKGDTIFLDASSTTYFMARYLKNIPDITIITNNPYLNIILSELKIHNFCTGGEMLNSSIALAGSEAEHFVRNIQADSFFFSARGICDGEISDSSKGERDIKTTMLQASRNHYFLCDTSKHGLRFPYRITNMNHIDAIIDEL